MPRDPFRFDVFDLFASHAQQQKATINSRETAEQFLERVRGSVEKALESRTFIYGHHTQALFEALTLSLGAVKLLKQEDAGDIYADEDLAVPDYRAVLRDNRHLLVEVKNKYQDEPFDDPLTLSRSYFLGTVRYAELMRCPLRFAVFWVRWNAWTLVSRDVFKAGANGYELTFSDAIINNDMALLGDKSIGTTFPLTMRFVTDPTKPRIVAPDGQATITIGDIKLFCKDTEITDPLEKNIAWYLMLYGQWGPAAPPDAKIVNSELEYAEDKFMPLEDSGQGFEIVGSLSSMYSAFYRQTTAPDGLVGQIRLQAVPGKLAELVPEGYHGKALPLWIIIQSPSHPL
jgi:hypothetical protein